MWIEKAQNHEPEPLVPEEVVTPKNATPPHMNEPVETSFGPPDTVLDAVLADPDATGKSLVMVETTQELKPQNEVLTINVVTGKNKRTRQSRIEEARDRKNRFMAPTENSLNRQMENRVEMSPNRAPRNENASDGSPSVHDRLYENSAQRASRKRVSVNGPPLNASINSKKFVRSSSVLSEDFERTSKSLRFSMPKLY